MKQPYIYTMPERFMEDESVPVKWRLYGYINGFWVAGKPVYATNEHFSKKLKCSERHVSRALADLESEGLLMRDVHGFKRYVLPGGMTPDVRGDRHGKSVKHDAGGQHISDSISEIELSAKAEVVEVREKDQEQPTKLPKDEKALSLIGWAEQRRGFKFTSVPAQLGAIGRAKKAGVSPARLKERWAELEEETWRNGFDWVDVVKSFDKRA